MLLILTTHPIQYQTPVWRLLAERGNIPFEVLFMSRQGLDYRKDPQFGQKITWDLDLLGGYPNKFLPSIENKNQSSPFWLRLNRDFGEWLMRKPPHALWLQGWQVVAYWQAAARAKRLGIPVWIRGDTNAASRSGGPMQPIRDFMLARLFKKIDRFLVVGSANRSFYQSFGIGPDRLEPAPHCVENARFESEAARSRPDRQRWRRAHGIPDDAFCVLFAGKLIQKKRPLDLIAALRIAQAMQPERRFHLLVAGTGAQAFEMRATTSVVFDIDGGGLVKPLNRNPETTRASYLGFVNQSHMPEVYAAADALVLPSERTETWGLVVNEAMASGLPALVSDKVGCSEDLVRPLRDDLIFPLGDVEAMANALLRIVEQPPDPDRIAEIIGWHTPLVMVETVERLYRELVG